MNQTKKGVDSGAPEEYVIRHVAHVKSGMRKGNQRNRSVFIWGNGFVISVNQIMMTSIKTLKGMTVTLKQYTPD